VRTDKTKATVLIVDDQVEEILWLLELLDHRGYSVTIATNEKDANARLDAVRAGAESYVAAIFDVMVSTLSIEEIIAGEVALDDSFFEDSKDTGLRLCRRARSLGLTIPIACLTVRQDAAVEALREELGIPVYHRVPFDPSESILEFLDRHLRPVGSSRTAPTKAASAVQRRLKRTETGPVPPKPPKKGPVRPGKPGS
jgi:CheY-like chemotaxis protein